MKMKHSLDIADDDCIKSFFGLYATISSHFDYASIRARGITGVTGT